MHRIVQLTDCHLFTEKATALREIVTWPRFQSVLQHLRQQLPDFDLLVLTGDIAHDEAAATYDAVIAELGDWIDKVRVIPGNHDRRAAIANRFPGVPPLCTDRIRFVEQWSDWQIIGLDSQLSGQVAGSLGSDQIQWLKERLTASRSLRTLLFLHHPPVPVHSPWLDKIGLQDAADLKLLLNEFPQVRLIGCGHVHHEIVASFGHTTVFSTPAVGPKFRPRTEQLVIDLGPPEYRLWELAPNGSWTTQLFQCTSQL
ncbi:metallophosphoesterase [Schlesneria sp. DSM 10557]|uniref:metallophosphoesterase n=1 Tax=Schlesneria sp. DSM 10557 TaxID=3044399 RepID=UPI00359FF894